MSVGEWILSIVLFIVALALMIIIHELGHFSMAKLFNVYCQEFSIGFGPALLKKRRKDGETYFSIRAVPLGGYVSMYGEGVELEDGVVVPPERSIEGIKKWKKAIVLVAGITLNIVLAFVIFSVKNLAFPIIQTTNIAHVEENSIAYVSGIRDDDRMQFIKAPDVESSTYNFEYTIDKRIYAGYFTIVDTNVQLEGKNWVLTYYPEGTKNETKFSEGAHLYASINQEQVISDNDYLNTYKQWFTSENKPIEGAPQFFPDFKQETLKARKDLSYTTNINFKNSNDEIKNITLNMSTELVEGKTDEYKWTENGLNFKTMDYWLPFGTRVQNIFVDFADSTTAVFRGLGVLFTGGIANMSGFVGILKTSAEIFGSYTFATYLYFWGLISVNLAIFNLLPFPGLDGFQLVVTGIEGITKKKIPNKFKNIMSTIGLLILIGLMIVILSFDIMRWVGVM